MKLKRNWTGTPKHRRAPLLNRQHAIPTPTLSVKAKVRKWRGDRERGRTENGKDEKMSYKL